MNLIGKLVYPVILMSLLAAGMWFVTFGLPDFGNFWVKISISAASLALISLFLFGVKDRENFQFEPRHIVWGVGSAAVLYGIFFLGDVILSALFPDFAPEQIGSIYARKIQLEPWAIALLLLFVTGPSEEIFWRGYLQNKLSKLMGPIGGLVLATLLYGFVHIWAFNLSLLLAALTAGLFWGILYHREKSLVPVIISHSLWSSTIFVFLPLH